MLGCIAFRARPCPRSMHVNMGVSFGTLYCMLGQNLRSSYARRGRVVIFFFFFLQARRRLSLFSSFAAAAMQTINNEWGGMRGNHRLPAQVLAQVLGTDYTYATPNGAFINFGADYHDDCCTVKRPMCSNSPPSVIASSVHFHPSHCLWPGISVPVFLKGSRLLAEFFCLTTCPTAE